MANPQCENGFTKIANEIMEALIKQKLSGHEFRLILLVIRKTYGYNKKEDAISLTQMSKNTGFSRIRCSQIINRLQLQKIVTVTENINGIGKKYQFNKDFEQWTPTVTENINRYKKVKSTVTVLRNRPLQKSDTTKESTTKESTTKDNLYTSVISYLNEKAGTSYKTTTRKTQDLIKARQKEGFTLEDFKKVIDRKVKQWQTDVAMSKFLRPETLFGTKFEGYLNEIEPSEDNLDAIFKP